MLVFYKCVTANLIFFIVTMVLVIDSKCGNTAT